MTGLFASLNMRTKLLAAPLFCLLMMIAAGAVSLRGLRTQQATIADLHDVRFAAYSRVARLTDAIGRVQTDLFRSISWARAGYDPNRLAALSKEVDARLTESRETLRQITSAP